GGQSGSTGRDTAVSDRDPVKVPASGQSTPSQAAGPDVIERHRPAKVPAAGAKATATKAPASQAAWRKAPASQAAWRRLFFRHRPATYRATCATYWHYVIRP